MIEHLAKIWAIAKKDMKIYYLKGPVVIFGLLLPLFLYLAYAWNRNIEPTEAMVSIMAMTIFFTSTAVGPVIAPWETRSRTFERLLSSPVNIGIILMGDALASTIFGVGITATIAVLSIVLGVHIANILTFTCDVIISAICFSFLSLLLSSPPTDTPADIMMLSSLLKFPLIFISGIFTPIGKMPYLLRIIALLSPLTYTTELFRESTHLETFIPSHIAITALIVYTLIFALMAIKLHERSAPKRL